MDKNSDRWVEERLGRLTPDSEWKPNVTKGLERLRERANEDEHTWKWAWAVAATTAACICLLALPGVRGVVLHFREDLSYKGNTVQVSAEATQETSDLPIPRENSRADGKDGDQHSVLTPGTSEGGRAAQGRRTTRNETPVQIEYLTADVVPNFLFTGFTMEGWETIPIALSVRDDSLIRSDAGRESSSTPPQIAAPPFDPFEPVTSQPETLKSPEARYAAISLMRRAVYSQAFFAPVFAPPYTHPEPGAPYTVGVSFTAGGATRDGGPGEMEETKNAAGARRWTGHLGGFSLTRIITDRFYDQGSAGPIPLRLQMVRWIVLGNLETLPDFTADSIRIANTELHGTSLTCILTAVTPTAASSRNWSEKEYCIDPKSERLHVYSAAPGIYIFYDYGGSADFHDHAVPDQFTVSEAGTVVLQGTIRVKDPEATSLDPALFAPTQQMATTGVGLLNPIYRVQSRETAIGSGRLQPVIVHATLAPDGDVVEAEALQTSNRTLSQSALELVRRTKYKIANIYNYPPQGEVFITVQ